MQPDSLKPIFSFVSLASFIALPQSLLAARFGNFEYIDNGTSITITDIYGYDADVTIPSTIDGKPVKTIGQYAFYSSQHIYTVFIPATVTSIERYAFYNCQHLTQITISPGLQTIGPSAFFSCRQLASITLPDTVDQIGDAAFSHCESLESFKLPESVTQVGDATFSYCTNLKSIKLPESVTQVGPGAFTACYHLKSIQMPGNMKTISDFLFSTCTSLQDITLPKNSQTVGAGAFYGCKSLSTVTLPDTVTDLGAEAFAYSGVTRIVIPENAKLLGKQAFYQCLRLRKVKFNSFVRDIETSTFSGCTQLSQVTLPQNLNRIGTWAFLGCPLDKINLNSVKQIESNAFRYCGKLNTVTFPKSLKSIGDGAFSNCGHLASAVFEGNAPMLGEAVFENPAPDFQIIVSDDSKQFTVPRWNGYRVSLPKEEIAVQQANGNHILSSAHTSRFEMTLAGSRSGLTFLKIHNVGNLPLKKLAATIIGGDYKDFQIRIPMKTMLAPGKSTTIGIVFKPKDKGKRQSTLRITSSDRNENPFEINLSGIGIREL